MKRLLEVCCGDLPSVMAAAEAGADRIELCSALSADGVTPSAGLTTMGRRLFSNRIHLLVRANDGDFCYTDREKELMLHDVASAASFGVEGVVVGSLDSRGRVDEEFVAKVMDIARREGLSVTFHRAFDRIADRSEALETLISLGVDRVLTSGGAPSAAEGYDSLHDLVSQADGRIVILAGGGVNRLNACSIIERTGCTEIHGSCREKGATHSSVNEIKAIINAIS